MSTGGASLADIAKTLLDEYGKSPLRLKVRSTVCMRAPAVRSLIMHVHAPQILDVFLAHALITAGVQVCVRAHSSGWWLQLAWQQLPYAWFAHKAPLLLPRHGPLILHH
jgi:hypothetical protein